MANVLNRVTKEFLASVNTPDFPPTEWIHNPDIRVVGGFASKYWTITGNAVTLKTPAERAAVDDDEFVELIENSNPSGEELYGDGSDGIIDINADRTLSQDLYPDILRVAAGVTVQAAGYRVMCKRGLILLGSWLASGSDAVAGVAGVGAPSGTLGGGGNGAAGGLAGGVSAVSSKVGALLGFGGSGGDGGTSGLSIGGSGGATANGDVRLRPRVQTLLNGFDFDSGLGSNPIVRYTGGGGGGGGGGLGGLVSGAGGGGGGVIVLAAPMMFMGPDAFLTSRGGAGGASSGLNSSGGGGGGGGAIFVVRREIRMRGRVSVAGGVGGSATGTGQAGRAGANGRILQFKTGS